MKKLLFCGLFIFMMMSAKAQATIENLLSVPFPSNLIASEDGKQMAWIFNDQGIRNVMIAVAPDFKVKKLTNNSLDNGIDLGDLKFTPNGDKLVFTEGNSNNHNPAQLQRETGKTVWVVNSGGTNLRKINKGSGALPSPDNKTIAFFNEGEVWIAPLDSGAAPKKLFFARGRLHSLRWSPDGNTLAFISARGDHSFLGIYDLEKKTVSYPDPSVDLDGEPVWSPDGQWLAYIRTPHIANQFAFTEIRESNPWSIRLLNVNTGEAKELWKASKGIGSVLYDNLPRTENLLMWSAGDYLVFPWEKEGWVHLYSLPAFKQAQPKLLTPGEGIVENVVFTKDRKSLVYTTNINDINRRHIWKVNITKGIPEQLSKGVGLEWSPVILENGTGILRSTATSPGWPSVIEPDGEITKIATDYFPDSFPEKLLVTPRPVTFKSKDGMLIHGQLFLPPDYDSNKKYPTLLFFHGGSRRQMLLGFHYMDYYSNDYAMNQFNALNGYITLSVNYRSGIGYGLNFREALNYGANGCSEYNDVIGAGIYMKNRKDVDSKTIGIWGGSYGGYLTAMGLAKNSDVFAAGIDIHGVHDWNKETKNWATDYNPALHEKFAKIAFQSSPINFVDGWRSPVLFIHGDDDRNVPFSESVNLVEKLRDRNVYFEQLIFPDEVHSFLLHKNWLKAYHTSVDFFKRMLLKE